MAKWSIQMTTKPQQNDPPTDLILILIARITRRCPNKGRKFPASVPIPYSWLVFFKYKMRVKLEWVNQSKKLKGLNRQEERQLIPVQDSCGTGT